jgi:hypothetical protein
MSAMSPGHFSHAFHDVVGMSLHDSVRDLRLRRRMTCADLYDLARSQRHGRRLLPPRPLRPSCLGPLQATVGRTAPNGRRSRRAARDRRTLPQPPLRYRSGMAPRAVSRRGPVRVKGRGLASAPDGGRAPRRRAVGGCAPAACSRPRVSRTRRAACRAMMERQWGTPRFPPMKRALALRRVIFAAGGTGHGASSSAGLAAQTSVPRRDTPRPRSRPPSAGAPTRRSTGCGRGTSLRRASGYSETRRTQDAACKQAGKIKPHARGGIHARQSESPMEGKAVYRKRLNFGPSVSWRVSQFDA